MSVDAPAPDPDPLGLAPAVARRRWRSASRSLLRDPGFVVGAAIVALFAICAVFAPLLAPYDPDVQHLEGLTVTGEPLPPGSHPFLLGTDELGRDVLSRLIYGARVALFIAIVPNAIALAVATTVGVLAGYLRGRTEWVLMRFTEMVMALPTFLLALALIAIVGAGLGPIVLALVLVTWTYLARVVYGEVLRLRELPYIEAVRALGGGPGRVIVRHLLPALRPLLITYFTLNAAFMVITESALGFLGFGVQPPTPSWGAMIGASRDLFFWPWLILLPGACLAALVIGLYLVGDGIQRRLDVRQRAVRI